MPNEQCIFCGNLADTKEHIPPKQFFKGTLEKSLITVPSCQSCNSGFQKDEVFFRQFWATFLMDRSPRAKELASNEIVRSIIKKPALGKQMFSQMKLVDLYTLSGLYAGKATAYNITKDDRARINRIVEKIIRGLYFKSFSKTIPQDWTISIYWITPQLEQEQKLQDLAKTLVWNVIKEDTFAYGLAFVPQTHQSVWIMDFFKIPLFYVLVVDKETANQKINNQ